MEGALDAPIIDWLPSDRHALARERQSARYIGPMFAIMDRIRAMVPAREDHTVASLGGARAPGERGFRGDVKREIELAGNLLRNPRRGLTPAAPGRARTMPVRRLPRPARERIGKPFQGDQSAREPLRHSELGDGCAHRFGQEGHRRRRRCRERHQDRSRNCVRDRR